MTQPRLCIYGAGAIGCYIGGRLLAAGHSLSFIGRNKIGEALAQNGLRISDYRHRLDHVKPHAIHYSEDPATAQDCAIIFVTVKSGDSERVAAELATLNLSNQVLVSLQNGLRNAAIFAEALPKIEIIPAMVPFNVVQQAPGHFHQGTEGNLVIGDSASAKKVKNFFNKSGIRLEISQDIQGVQSTKLLMNLNNALNALCGIPLLEQIQDRRYRKIMAAIIEEGLQVIENAGIKTRRMGKIIPATLPFILRLPTPIFLRIARAMLAIDPSARSSMYDDLHNKRKTEVNYLNGEIVRLAEKNGAAAPLNAWLCDAIKQAEQRMRGSPCLSSEQIQREIGLS